MSDLEKRLRQVLQGLRYESSIGRGTRGVMEHHVDALVEDLLPFIQEILDDAQEEGE